MEVNEGRWGRSEGRIGSLKVRCKSSWLLHFAAALAVCFGPGQLDKSTECDPSRLLPAALSEDLAAAFHDDESSAVVGDRRRGSTSIHAAGCDGDGH